LIVLHAPLSLLATLAIIMAGKGAIGFGLARLFGQPRGTALMIAVSRAQIGEFSFILAGLGVALALLPDKGRDLILAGAIISILLNPLLFAGLDRMQARHEAAAPAAPAEAPAREPIPVTSLTDHVVLVGHGRVGSFISAALIERKTPLLVIEANADSVTRLKDQGVDVIVANAADPEAIAAANLRAARCLLVAVADAFEGGQVVEQARQLNAGLAIIARAHSQAEFAHLQQHGASEVIMGEHEIAKAMLADIPAHAA
jgi:CPA2 family monovalent cation:H+ antiporter-2